MSGEGDEEYSFLCPECDESLAVNGSMKTALIERGCVICGTTVTTAAFSEPPSDDTPDCS